MPLNIEQQIYQLLEKSKNILIIFKNNGNADGLASALALGQVLKKFGKNFYLAANDFELLEKFAFLPNASWIRAELPALKKFIIVLNVERTKVEELNYDIQDNKLRIYLTPKNGFFVPEDVSTKDSNFTFDLIFALNAEDLESLGNLYANNTEFFYETPIINIDHHADNEHFGQINHINLIATSTAEIIYSLIEVWDKNLFDEDIATLLLAGIITKTKNFKSLEITPQTLVAASKLIALGGRREEIVTNLYRTKLIPDLKLWGRALARLNISAKNPRLIWSTLTRQDFEKSGARKETLHQVVEEMIATIPEAEVVALFYEDEAQSINILVASYNKNLNVFNMTGDYRPSGSSNKATFSIAEKTLDEVEAEIIAKLEEKIAKTLML